MFFFLLIDFDSVDKVILTRPHIIGEYRIDVKKAVPKDQRHMQVQQQQQFQQQQQYALQMQAAAAYHYCYNNPAYNLLTNGSCTLPIPSTPPPPPSSLITTNGAGLNDLFSHLRTTNINNNFRYIPTRNNRRQSSRGSQ